MSKYSTVPDSAARALRLRAEHGDATVQDVRTAQARPRLMRSMGSSTRRRASRLAAPREALRVRYYEYTTGLLRRRSQTGSTVSRVEYYRPKPPADPASLAWRLAVRRLYEGLTRASHSLPDVPPSLQYARPLEYSIVARSIDVHASRTST